MKILHINYTYGFLSTGENCKDIHEYLIKCGVDSYVACSEGTEQDRIVTIGTKAEKKVHALMSRLTGLPCYYSIHGTMRLLQYINRLKPDIVHINNVHANYLNLNMLLRYLAKHKIVTFITLHDCFFYTGKCCHYTEKQCYKWMSGCGTCEYIRDDNKSYFFDFTHKMWKDKKERFSDLSRLYIIGVSEWITNEARKSFLQNAKALRRIYNWVDLDTFTPRAKVSESVFDGMNKKIILGVASYWNSQKGLRIASELAEMLGDDYCVALVGAVLEECSSKILCIGTVRDKSRLAGLYVKAEVFVNFSKEESFGKVAAEALACGTPIITNKYTANPELCGEGCGFVVEEISAENIKDSIMKIEKQGKAKFSNKCRKFAESEFDKRANLKAYYDYYTDAIRMDG